MAARTKSQFISVCGQGGEASMNLTTSAGMANVHLNCTLGHPGTPSLLFPLPSPRAGPATPPRRPRYRGPAENEKNRLRAARHQATEPVSSTPTSSIVPASVTSTTASAGNSFHCDECDFTSTTEHVVKIHMSHQHRNSQKPEEIHGETLNKSLNISLLREEREGNNSVSSSIYNAVNISIVNEALEKDPKTWCIKEISTTQEMVFFSC